MNLRERIEWVFRIGLLVFILAAAAFLSAVTAMRFAIQGREVSMPNLVGKSSADALAVLQGRGLQLKVVDRVYTDLPINAVARQSPPEGERMKVGQNAHVVLSLGAQNVTTPSLMGESLRVARIQLLQAGPATGRSDHRGHRHATMSDTILQQTPAPGIEGGKPARGSSGGAGRHAYCVRDALAGGDVAAGCRSPDHLFRPEIAACHFRRGTRMAEGLRHAADARTGHENYDRVRHRNRCGRVTPARICRPLAKFLDAVLMRVKHRIW